MVTVFLYGWKGDLRTKIPIDRQTSPHLKAVVKCLQMPVRNVARTSAVALGSL